MPALPPADRGAATNADTAAFALLLRSLGQIVLQPHAGTGACLLAALALTAPRLACAALIGATAANVCAIVAGHAQAAIRDGLAGYNGALAALAVCTLGTRPVICATMLAAALHLAAARCGLPAMTAPFVLASWIVHAVVRRLNTRYAHRPLKESPCLSPTARPAPVPSPRRAAPRSSNCASTSPPPTASSRSTAGTT